MPNVFSFTGHCKDYVTNGIIFVTNGRRKKKPEVILKNYFGAGEEIIYGEVKNASKNKETKNYFPDLY
ncbi:MAG: hypothetical protein K0S33_1952 [Bacteroidetes bacterium]|jgi:hypothetical protein|nr:hypothetical protein [Bacteroidota bacterium]